MRSLRLGEKREWKRFRIDCPVTLKISSRRKAAESVHGRLLDIGIGGARIHSRRHLEAGSRVVLHARFRDAKQRETIVRFEGVVQRADDQPVYEIAVQFRRSGRVIRHEMSDLLTLRPAA